MRAAVPPRVPAYPKLSVIDGLPAGTARRIALLERSRLGPGTVRRALAGWKRTVHRRNIRDVLDEAACPCCDPAEDRDVLQQALNLLDPRSRRELRALVEPLDDLFQKWTVHDPQAGPDRPWWRQRA